MELFPHLGDVSLVRLIGYHTVMIGLGRTVIGAGVLLILIGVGILIWGRLGLPTRLPGDITFRRGPVTFYFPVVTSIVLSLILTLLLNLFLRRR